MRFSTEALVLQKQAAATKASKACMKAVFEDSCWSVNTMLKPTAVGDTCNPSPVRLMQEDCQFEVNRVCVGSRLSEDTKWDLFYKIIFLQLHREIIQYLITLLYELV